MRESMFAMCVGMIAALWLAGIVLSLRLDRPEMAVLALCAFIVTMIVGWVEARRLGVEDAERRFRQSTTPENS